MGKLSQQLFTQFCQLLNIYLYKNFPRQRER